MWIITNFGFFSIVEKPDDKQKRTLTVRGRVKADLENLRDKYLPTLGSISEDTGTDYQYRAKAPRLDIAAALSQIASDIDYSNFKNSVAEKQEEERSKLYHGVWDVLYGLQAKKVVKARSTSYGGVLLNEQKQVLLRRPKGDYDGYVWTFAKGKQERGATPEESALREVKEETSYTAEIIAKIPGQFRGGTGMTEFFLMHPLGKPAAFDKSETEAIIWVSLEDAKEHIAQTRNDVGRNRDQAVLEATVRYLEEHARTET